MSLPSTEMREELMPLLPAKVLREILIPTWATFNESGILREVASFGKLGHAEK